MRERWARGATRGGVSLIELLVGVVMGAIVMTAVTQFFSF